jgi:uncharacterized Zn-binding protein involved in type VI secretion
MPGAFPQSRIGDMSMGHWISIFYFPPTPLIEGSPDTFACCIAASRVGDAANRHFAWVFGFVPLPAYYHEPKASTGSTTKFINNKPAFRVMDRYSCGDSQAQGCERVMVGG